MNKISKLIDLGLLSSSILEFFLETFLRFRFHPRYQQRIILEFLSIFEIIKFFLRCLKLEKNNNRKIFISERSFFYADRQVELDSLKDFQELFNFECTSSDDVYEHSTHSPPQLEKELKKISGNYNKGYKEIFPRTKKMAKQITTLPIPMEMFFKNKNDEAENIRIWLGELIYIFRPVIYCFCLLFFKYSSFKPFIISFILDVLRLGLQRNIKFHWEMERKEFVKRNYDLIFNYVFRNPVYHKFLKGKLLRPLLGKITSSIILKKLFFWLIELRLSFCFLM